MIKYNYKYYHKILLQLLSEDFSKYMFASEKDLLFHALENGEIANYAEIDWRWLSEDLYEEEYYGGNYWYITQDKLEQFVSRFISIEVRIRILEFLRDNCRECLLGDACDSDSCAQFEVECARLISAHKELMKKIDAIPDPFREPTPDTDEFIHAQLEPKHTILEGAILAGLKEYRKNGQGNIVSEDVLLDVAYEFINDFEGSVLEYEDSGRKEEKKPCMSQKKYVDIIRDLILKRVKEYDGINRDPIYQVFFIVGCLMGMPDHRHSWWEKNFAVGIGDYLEKTKNYSGCKAKIKQVIKNMTAMVQTELDFGIDQIEQAKTEIEGQAEQPIKDTPQAKPTQEPLSIEQKAVQQFVNKLNTLAQMLHKEWDGKKVPTGLHQPDAVIRINTEGISQFLNGMLSNKYDDLKELCYPPTSNSKQKFVQFVIKLRNKGYLGELPNNLLAKQLAPIVELSEGTVKNYLSKMS